MNKKWPVLIELVLLLLLSINILYAISGALHFPMSHIDVWSDWLYKAKALYVFHYSLDFLVQAHNQFNHPQYPLLLPLLYAGVYQMIGGVNEMAVSLFSPVVYVVILIVCYRFLRSQRYTKNTALLFTYIYSMLSPLIAQGGRLHAGMPDIFITLGHWVALTIVWKAQQKKNSPEILSWWLVLVCLLASSIKTEGLLIAAYFFCMPLSTLQKWQRIFVASLATMGWEVVVALLHIPKTYGISLTNLPQVPVRLVVTVKDTFQELFLNINNWYIFWWLFFCLLATTRITNTFIKKTVIPLLLVFSVAFVGIYLFATVHIDGYVSSSLDRLLLQISPLWFVIFAHQITEVFNYFAESRFKKYLKIITVR